MKSFMNIITYFTWCVYGVTRDPFWYLGGDANNVTDNNVIRQTASSFYDVMQTIGLTGVAIMIMIAAIRMMFAKKGNKLEEAKNQIAVQTVIGIVICAFTWVIGTIFSITKSLA